MKFIIAFFAPILIYAINPKMFAPKLVQTKIIFGVYKFTYNPLHLGIAVMLGFIFLSIYLYKWAKKKDRLVYNGY
jgi:hypothetical protein